MRKSVFRLLLPATLGAAVFFVCVASLIPAAPVVRQLFVACGFELRIKLHSSVQRRLKDSKASQPGCFDSVIGKLKTISEFKYKLTTPNTNEPLFRLLSPQTRCKKEVFVFSNQFPNALIADTIMAAVDKLNPDDASVTGKDANCKDATCQILDSGSSWQVLSLTELQLHGMLVAGAVCCVAACMI